MVINVNDDDQPDERWMAPDVVCVYVGPNKRRDELEERALRSRNILSLFILRLRFMDSCVPSLARRGLFVLIYKCYNIVNPLIVLESTILGNCTTCTRDSSSTFTSSFPCSLFRFPFISLFTNLRTPSQVQIIKHVYLKTFTGSSPSLNTCVRGR